MTSQVGRSTSSGWELDLLGFPRSGGWEVRVTLKEVDLTSHPEEVKRSSEVAKRSPRGHGRSTSEVGRSTSHDLRRWEVDLL